MLRKLEKLPSSKMETDMLQFTLRKPEKFPGYEMETENFTIYVTQTRIFSDLRNGNWKFYGLRYVNRKNFRVKKWKLEISTKKFWITSCKL